ncbi:hypothetical protein Daura_31550 [Dactylosporangium aurantiacum]|uniref:Peptidase C-terminal archaeal/bacterial domain-containing protein n=1 Tax=Dactylosporangium aurantiacum TaxID=35754 RepID=A0A9Q9MCS7_9ACTN|nr:pre-peptidase C-terminal domain-containing protein [Dactylosporangium aurantiacum]MDG6109565.1 hypothetical protein [Dactylosporangium aurantiacum]UWZ51279.1 hypothetical protein Daura_31550 [Dactylosporangium aurantiacum]
MHLARLSTAIVLTTAALVPLQATAAHASVSRVRQGSATDVARSAWSGPAFVMNGSGAVVPATMSSALNAVRGGTGTLDVVVIAGSGSTTPECDVIIGLAGVNSCTTLTLTAAADGNNTQVNTDIRNAEFVYFAGGDQCRYVAWKGTALEASVESVVAKGGGSGGGSAGLHVNSDIVYDACGGSATSATALADPYNAAMTFTTGMFGWPNYLNTINDSHFVTRDRMGRTMAFVARAIADGRTSAGKAWGVGIEEGGSFVIDRNGLATLAGQNAYVVLGDHTPERAVPGQPLTYSDYKIWRIVPGGTFDFKNRPTCGYYLRSVTNGTPGANLYNGTPTTGCDGGGGGTPSSFTETEPNNSRSAANAVTVPATVTGDLATSGDRDYYRLTLPAGATLTVTCAVPTAYDADIYLLSSGGSTLTRSVNDGAGADEAVTYTNSGASTTVYLDVEAYSGTGTADYTCGLTTT